MDLWIDLERILREQANKQGAIGLERETRIKFGFTTRQGDHGTYLSGKGKQLAFAFVWAEGERILYACNATAEILRRWNGYN